MKNITLIGQIDEVGEKELVGQNQMPKITVVLKTVEEHPQYYKIDFLNSNTSLAENLTLGQNYEITAALTGRKYTNDQGNTSIFHGLNGWKTQQV